MCELFDEIKIDISAQLHIYLSPNLVPAVVVYSIGAGQQSLVYSIGAGQQSLVYSIGAGQQSYCKLHALVRP